MSKSGTAASAPPTDPTPPATTTNSPSPSSPISSPVPNCRSSSQQWTWPATTTATPPRIPPTSNANTSNGSSPGLSTEEKTATHGEPDPPNQPEKLVPVLISRRRTDRPTRHVHKKDLRRPPRHRDHPTPAQHRRPTLRNQHPTVRADRARRRSAGLLRPRGLGAGTRVAAEVGLEDPFSRPCSQRLGGQRGVWPAERVRRSGVVRDDQPLDLTGLGVGVECRVLCRFTNRIDDWTCRINGAQPMR